MQHQTVKKIGSGAAVAAIGLLVGGATAEAATRPDDRAMRGPGAVALTNAWVAAGNVARPDDRPTHGPGANAAARRDVVLRPDDRADRSLPSGAPVAPPSGGDGFDWVDAGVGSAATLGLVLLVAGASVVRLRQGSTGGMSENLTPREREVVTLVAGGMTNAEIARQLWISPGTVRRHLENVFAKLGVHTRTAAVARLRPSEPYR